MQYVNIAKALEEIATSELGVTLADHIASSLSKKNKAEVVAINQALNFNFPIFRTRPANGDKILKLRRAAMLIAKTFDALPVLLPGGGAAPYESWDEQELEKYIRLQKQNAQREPAPAGPPGPYLGASFWAYSTEEERLTAMAAYQEALELCTFGLLAATHATRASAIGHSPRGVDTYTDLVAMWFGSAPETVTTVKTVLHNALSGLKTNYIRLGYGGRNANPVGEAAIQEGGFGSGGAMTATVRPMGGEFAFVPSKGSGVRNKIVLCMLFFDSKNTTITLRDEIVAMGDENKMDVTRSGAIVHEATHAYAGTVDVELDNDVYEHIGWTKPGAGEKREKAYGPLQCLALARKKPAEALKNADSYRIFCELAKYHRQHAGAPIMIR